MEDFDPMEMYVAIADFEGVEKSNVSLRAGQCVQVRFAPLPMTTTAHDVLMPCLGGSPPSPPLSPPPPSPFCMGP